jgi:hypothetical protein
MRCFWCIEFGEVIMEGREANRRIILKESPASHEEVVLRQNMVNMVYFMTVIDRAKCGN